MSPQMQWTVLSGTVLALLGAVGGVAYGVSLWSEPFGWIVGGIGLAGVSIRVASFVLRVRAR